ncbi:MAG: hypothetical protein RLZZ329_907 [Pseudomonadota bacterium]
MGGPLRPAFGWWRDVAKAIGKKAQRPFGRDARIELAHRTSCRIARIDKGFFALGARRYAFTLACVQGFKIVAPHVDLAAHFQHGRRIDRQTQRNLPDGADVGGDLFAGFTVAPSGRLHQHPVFVAQAHGQTIKFQLTHIAHGWIGFAQAQLFADARVKCLRTTGFRVGFGANAEHGHAVRDLRKGIQNLAAHTLGGRIGRQQLGMGRLQRLQFAEQPVVFGIGDFRRIERVISVCMLVQYRPQLRCSFGWRHRLGGPCHFGRFAQWQSAKQVRMGHGECCPNQEKRRRACGVPADNSRASSASYSWCRSLAIWSSTSSPNICPLPSVTTPSMCSANKRATSRKRPKG